MPKKAILKAKSIIPIRSKRSTAAKYQVGDVKKGEEVVIVDVTTLRGNKFGELEDGNFVIIERDGVANFE